jgi:redox-regulated HSP33 family molecular chaperone
MRTSLEIRDGKFFRDGQPEPLKFGDKEQIALLEKEQKRVKELADEGLLIEPDLTISADIYFKCLCGHSLTEFVEVQSEDEVNEAFAGESVDCRYCKRKYTLSQDSFGDLRVHLQSKTLTE